MKDRKKFHFPYSLLIPLTLTLVIVYFSVNVIAGNAEKIAQYSAMALVGYDGHNDWEDSGSDAFSSTESASFDEVNATDSSDEEEVSSVAPPREVTNQPVSSAVPKSGKSTKSSAKVIEQTYGKAGLNFGNISVKNSNKNHTIDIETVLKKKPDIKIKKNKNPQVLILHTHTSEAYANKFTGSFESSFRSRGQKESENIISLGNIVEAALKKAGIGVVHDKTYHDYPEYTGAYSRAKDTIKKNLKKYPSIQVVLDLHRDAIIQSSGSRIKPTAVINKKKAAQIMIISGCDDEGKLGFKDWELNMRFAVRLQKTMADTYPTLARPINFAPRQYNMNLTHGSLLVEFGTDVNTLDEATYSAQLFSTCLVKTLNKLQ